MIPATTHDISGSCLLLALVVLPIRPTAQHLEGYYDIRVPQQDVLRPPSCCRASLNAYLSAVLHVSSQPHIAAVVSVMAAEAGAR